MCPSCLGQPLGCGCLTLGYYCTLQHTLLPRFSTFCSPVHSLFPLEPISQCPAWALPPPRAVPESRSICPPGLQRPAVWPSRPYHAQFLLPCAPRCPSRFRPVKEMSLTLDAVPGRSMSTKTRISQKTSGPEEMEDHGDRKGCTWISASCAGVVISATLGLSLIFFRAETKRTKWLSVQPPIIRKEVACKTSPLLIIHANSSHVGLLHE